LLIGSASVSPFPQLVIPPNLIQNGADAIALYLGNDFDFPDGTLATQTNLVDALAYDTSDADDTILMGLLGLTEQINEGSSNNTNSIQRFDDGLGNPNSITYTATTPTPRALNDGSGVVLNGLFTTVSQTQINEDGAFDITFTTEQQVTSDLTINFSLNNFGFNTSDYTGSTSVMLLNGQDTVTTTISIIDDTLDEGDEVLKLVLSPLPTDFLILNNNLEIRVVDNDFTMASFGVPTSQPYPNLNPAPLTVQSTQPTGYYDSIHMQSGAALEQALQDIIAEEGVVRAQTYSDVIDILEEADQNPANSNQVWLVYTEQGRAKLDYQTTSNNVGAWNREHTFPRSLAGYGSIDLDDIRDGKEVFWNTTADSLRHGNSDAHALRAADGPENSIRSNNHYGQYNGPAGNASSFKGDVARSVLFMQIRYNGLSVVNGYPSNLGQMGDLATLLEWHRNDPPDNFEMNRNNIVYEWQVNRNPFIDLPDLVEYIWGTNVGVAWDNNLSVTEFNTKTLKLFPNPVNNQLFITGKSNEYEVVIYSSEGRKIQSKTLKNNTPLNLELASGMYFAKISSEGKTETKKFLVK
jgi:endonuclease I